MSLGNTNTIAGQKGRNFLLKINNGLSPANYNTVTGGRALEITINGNPVDITTKSSGGWQELLPAAGIQSVDITCSGVLDAAAPAVAISLLKAAMLGGTMFQGKIVSDAGDSFTGTFSVVTAKRSGTHNDAEMYDFTLKSHGPVAYHGF